MREAGHIRRVRRAWFIVFTRVRILFLSLLGQDIAAGRGSTISIQADIIVDRSGKCRIGRYTHIRKGCELVAFGEIRLGNRVFINRDCMIVSREGIIIGDNVRIGERVSIRDHDHDFANGSMPIVDQGYRNSRILIEDDVWIGCNAVILKGVRIGRHSVVAAGAVVNKSVAPNSIVGGVPAKLLRRIA